MNIKWDMHSRLRYDRCTQNTIQPWCPLLHLALLTPKWQICVTIQHRQLPSIHAQRMGTSNNPFLQILMEIFGWSDVEFLLVFGLADI
jgi:hypothetical protein